MSAHFKEICRVCGALITQCRCPALDKTVRYGICEGCKQRETER